MAECKPIGTPMEVNFTIKGVSKTDLTYERKCRSLIGSLMYATIGTRREHKTLAQSVYYLSRFQSVPNEDLWKALKRILRYIKGTINYKLEYTNKNDSSIIGCADADWVRDNDRKSTSGYSFKIYDNTVTWRSKKQATIALSTTEAECIDFKRSGGWSMLDQKIVVWTKIRNRENNYFWR